MNRHDFLLAAGSLAAAPAGSRPAAHATASVKRFDVNAFNALLSRPARHRQCFGATERRGGAVLYQMRNSIRAYNDVLKETARAMHAIAVLYAGDAISIAYDDELWNQLLIPVVSGAADVGRLKPGSGNPYRDSISELSSLGSELFVCNNALTEDARIWSHVKQQTSAEMYEYIASHLVPNATIVPAGVMAINAAQEAHFSYIAV